VTAMRLNMATVMVPIANGLCRSASRYNAVHTRASCTPIYCWFLQVEI
jgi:hypothetical protein